MKFISEKSLLAILSAVSLSFVSCFIMSLSGTKNADKTLHALQRSVWPKIFAAYSWVDASWPMNGMRKNQTGVGI
jgi:hypothetical protein